MMAWKFLLNKSCCIILAGKGIYNSLKLTVKQDGLVLVVEFLECIILRTRSLGRFIRCVASSQPLSENLNNIPGAKSNMQTSYAVATAETGEKN